MTREEAILCLKGMKNYARDTFTEQTDWQTSLDIAIKALEQEPKTGYWIAQPSNKEQGERNFIWWKCSECGQVIFSETEHDRLEFHTFCGRCGADMRGSR